MWGQIWVYINIYELQNGGKDGLNTTASFYVQVQIKCNQFCIALVITSGRTKCITLLWWTPTAGKSYICSIWRVGQPQFLPLSTDGWYCVV